MDLDAVALTLVKLSQLATDLDQVAEIDINPLRASPAGVVAIDVRIALTDRKRGIGRLLMRHLIEYAASRGIGMIYGDVLADNSPMLALCRQLGFRIGIPSREAVLKVSLDPLRR